MKRFINLFRAQVRYTKAWELQSKSPLVRGFRGVSTVRWLWYVIRTGKALLFGILILGISNLACVGEKEEVVRDRLKTLNFRDYIELSKAVKEVEMERAREILGLGLEETSLQNSTSGRRQN